MTDLPSGPPSFDPTEQVCGDLIHFPPARCSRHLGHGGEHQTAEIPAPLSAVAARMVRESDALMRERDALRDQYAEKMHRLRAALYVCIGTSAAGVAAVIACVYVALMMPAPQ